jgi:IS1 family transposase
MGDWFVMPYVLTQKESLFVLHLLVEGNSLRSIQRLTGVHRDTVARLMVKVGDRLREFMDRRMRNLELNHLQCDEIWTFVRKKQGRLEPPESWNEAIGDQFLFIALDEETKLIPSFAIGKRTLETTRRFINDLASRLVLVEPFQRGPHPQLSTDGWRSYRPSIEEAFGQRADHGVLIKSYAQGEQPGRHGPPVLTHTDRRVISGEISPMEICTSHVERHNLSIRTFLRRFTRLALGFSKKLENLAACVALYIAHYNFCRNHGSLPGTPAMAAEIAGHPWTMEELFDAE